MNPREAALSRLIGEADQLIRRGFAEVTARGSTAKMKRIIARIAKERRARHTFASHPDLMGRLEGELARDVRFIKMAMNIPATERTRRTRRSRCTTCSGRRGRTRSRVACRGVS